MFYEATDVNAAFPECRVIPFRMDGIGKAQVEIGQAIAALYEEASNSERTKTAVLKLTKHDSEDQPGNGQGANLF